MRTDAWEPCRRCGQPVHPEDMTDHPDDGTEWAGVCLLCFWDASESENPELGRLTT
jgi:hypothetical protein